MSMRDDHTCRLVSNGTVYIKMYDGTMRELKEVKYITRMTKNLISVENLEAEGLRETLGEGILKMFSGSLGVLKDINDNIFFDYPACVELFESVTNSSLHMPLHKPSTSSTSVECIEGSVLVVPPSKKGQSKIIIGRA